MPGDRDLSGRGGKGAPHPYRRLPRQMVERYEIIAEGGEYQSDGRRTFPHTEGDF